MDEVSASSGGLERRGPGESRPRNEGTAQPTPRARSRPAAARLRAGPAERPKETPAVDLGRCWRIVALVGIARRRWPITSTALAYESTDDAFVDGHVVPVSPRVAGHVAKVYVTDNQWVKQGRLARRVGPARLRGPAGGGGGGAGGGPGRPEARIASAPT